jgi:hypothetical protein
MCLRVSYKKKNGTKIRRKESDPELDPDPDPRIRIRTKMSRIPNTEGKAITHLYVIIELIKVLSRDAGTGRSIHDTWTRLRDRKIYRSKFCS